MLFYPAFGRPPLPRLLLQPRPLRPSATSSAPAVPLRPLPLLAVAPTSAVLAAAAPVVVPSAALPPPPTPAPRTPSWRSSAMCAESAVSGVVWSSEVPVAA